MKFIRVMKEYFKIALYITIPVILLDVGLYIERQALTPNRDSLSIEFDASFKKLCAKVEKQTVERCLETQLSIYKPKFLPFLHSAFARAKKERSLIFIPEAWVTHFEKAELDFIIAHELGHILRNTSDESEADKFASELLGADPGIKALNRTATLPPNFFGKSISSSLRNRIQALERLKPLS